MSEARFQDKSLEKKFCFACTPTAGRCPICGKKLRTLRAQQCHHCHASWHSEPPAYANDYKVFAKEVRGNMKWVNRVLVTGTTVIGMIVLLKLTGATSYNWNDVRISTDDSWLIALALTISNFYASFLFFNSIWKLSESKHHDTNRSVFNDLSTTGGLFVRGLIPRLQSRTTISKVHVYKMDMHDPTTWLALGSAILIPLAIIPFSWNGTQEFLRHVILAFTLLWINWKIGATWIIALSRLAISEGESRYLDRLSWFNSILSFNTWVATRGPLYAILWLCYQILFLAAIMFLASNIWTFIQKLF